MAAVDKAATEAVIEGGNGLLWAFVATTGAATADDTVIMNSKDEYGEAFSKVFDFGVGDTDSNVVSGQLLQKMIHVTGAISFWVANRIGYDAGLKGKMPGGLGVAW